MNPDVKSKADDAGVNKQQLSELSDDDDALNPDSKSESEDEGLNPDIKQTRNSQSKRSSASSSSSPLTLVASKLERARLAKADKERNLKVQERLSR